MACRLALCSRRAGAQPDGMRQRPRRAVERNAAQPFLEGRQPRPAQRHAPVDRGEDRAAVVGETEQGESAQVFAARIGAEIVVDDDDPLLRGHRGDEPFELLADRRESAVLQQRGLGAARWQRPPASRWPCSRQAVSRSATSSW